MGPSVRLCTGAGAGRCAAAVPRLPPLSSLFPPPTPPQAPSLRQAPDDKNDGWATKVLVVLSLLIAELSVLLFPLDVANRRSCPVGTDLAFCSLTMPMRGLWGTVWMCQIVLAFVAIPFALFFYETDSGPVAEGGRGSAAGRLRTASLYTLGCVIVSLLMFFVPYGVVGWIDYPVDTLVSGAAPVSALSQSGGGWPGAGAGGGCVPPGGTSPQASAGLCAAESVGGAAPPTTTWSRRAAPLVYVVALVSVLAGLLLAVFSAVGLVALPFDWIADFINRPKKVITRTEYNQRARELAKRASELKEIGQSLRREEQEVGGTRARRNRKWRNQAAELARQTELLGADARWLQQAFPQGEGREAAWYLTVLAAWLRLVGGVVGAIVGVLWLIHLTVYLFLDPPAGPFLNAFFDGLQRAWGLLSTLAFSLFCLYFLAATVHGLFRLGLWVGVGFLHPMRLNGTYLSTLLFNSGLVLILSTALVQFCAWAFGLYAEGTVVHAVWATEVRRLRGFGPLYEHRVFQWTFVAFLCATLLWYAAMGARRRRGDGDV